MNLRRLVEKFAHDKDCKVKIAELVHKYSYEEGLDILQEHIRENPHYFDDPEPEAVERFEKDDADADWLDHKAKHKKVSTWKRLKDHRTSKPCPKT